MGSVRRLCWTAVAMIALTAAKVISVTSKLASSSCEPSDMIARIIL
jgi:hypothetical protein